MGPHPVGISATSFVALPTTKKPSTGELRDQDSREIQQLVGWVVACFGSECHQKMKYTWIMHINPQNMFIGSNCDLCISDSCWDSMFHIGLVGVFLSAAIPETCCLFQSQFLLGEICVFFRGFKPQWFVDMGTKELHTTSFKKIYPPVVKSREHPSSTGGWEISTLKKCFAVIPTPTIRNVVLLMFVPCIHHGIWEA